MLNKISDAQRSMLLTASGRDDRIVTPPINARAPALKAFADKLIEAGWGRFVKARNGAPVWRKDAESGQIYALQLTAKGLKAAAAANKENIELSAVAPVAAAAAPKTLAPASAPTCDPQMARASKDTNEAPESVTIQAPRANSKIGRVLDMLASDAGATISDLTAATGWLEHTTRAALTGLRRRGYAVSLARNERDGASVYRIAAGGSEATQ
jgi:hypothetical protein